MDILALFKSSLKLLRQKPLRYWMATQSSVRYSAEEGVIKIHSAGPEQVLCASNDIRFWTTCDDDITVVELTDGRKRLIKDSSRSLAALLANVAPEKRKEPQN